MERDAVHKALMSVSRQDVKGNVAFSRSLEIFLLNFL